MTLVLEKYWMCPCDSSWGSQGYSSSHKALDFGWLTKYGANLPVKACKSGIVVDAGQITETIKMIFLDIILLNIFFPPYDQLPMYV